MSSYQNLTINQGADFDMNIDVSSDNSIDMNDYELLGVIKKSYTSNTGYNFTITVDELAVSTVIISLPASISESMKPGRYVYDVYARHTDSDRRFVIIRGSLEIIPAISKYES